jgi:ribosomal protein S18 acetylase RimI-like enzyme
MKDLKIKIRISTPNDVFKIREIQRITWIETYPNAKAGISVEDIKNKFKDDKTLIGKKKIEERKEKYKDKRKRTWVAEHKEEMVGFCLASREEEKGRIKAIYVLPEYQGEGIGSKLMKKAIEWLSEEKQIYINVVEYNLKAINFYEKHGFSKTGKRGVFDSAAVLPSGKNMIEVELVKYL